MSTSYMLYHYSRPLRQITGFSRSIGRRRISWIRVGILDLEGKAQREHETHGYVCIIIYGVSEHFYSAKTTVPWTNGWNSLCHSYRLIVSNGLNVAPTEEILICSYSSFLTILLFIQHVRIKKLINFQSKI